MWHAGAQSRDSDADPEELSPAAGGWAMARWAASMAYNGLWLGSAAFAGLAFIGTVPNTLEALASGLPNGVSLGIYATVASAGIVALAAVAAILAGRRTASRNMAALYALASLSTIILFVVVNVRVSTADLQGVAW
jgi:hypothetical protein